MLVIRPLLALATALLIPGCASGGLPNPGGELSTLPPGGAHCVADLGGDPLPAADQLVDSAALVGTLPAGASGPGARYVLLTMEWEPEGSNVHRRVIEHNVEPALADSVQQLVFRTLRPAPERPGGWGARLRVDLGPTPRLRVGRREVCPPVPRDRVLVEALARGMPAGPPGRGGPPAQVVTVALRVNEVGAVTGGSIVRGETPGGTRERVLIEWARGYFFEPGTVDGIPTPSTIEMRMRLPN